MLFVVTLVLALIGAWTLMSVGVAVLTGGVIRARDERDVPAAGRRPLGPFPSASPR